MADEQEPQLLETFVATRSDDAFRALIDQYVGLVYSACLRQLKDRHLAEDATQAVFLLLSRKAGALRGSPLAGWLLITARYACANMRRSRQRRVSREQVVAMHPHTPAPDENNDLLELLDEALCHLRAGEREALVLRYLREEPMGDVAAMLGVSQAAARKRVDRGMEKLRSYFARRGIAATSAGLGVVLSEQVRGAMLPSMVRQSITQGIIQVCHAGTQSTAASVAIAKETRRLMRITKIKSAAVAMTLAMALGTSGWMISRAMAQKAPAAQAGGAMTASAAPSGAAVPAAAALPATKPSTVDLSTPESALKSFFTALGDGDRAAAYQCLTADPHRTANLMDAMLAWDMAQSGLTRAAQQKYGDASRVQRFTTLESVAQIVGYAPPAQIEGQVATITTFIPPQLIEVAPQQYRPALVAWSGAALSFQKQGDLWKFDIDRSMRVDLKLQSKTETITDPAVMAGVLMDNAQMCEEAAAGIRGGKLARVGDAVAALNAAAARISRKRGFTSMSFNVLPVSAAK